MIFGQKIQKPQDFELWVASDRPNLALTVPGPRPKLWIRVIYGVPRCCFFKKVTQNTFFPNKKNLVCSIFEKKIFMQIMLILAKNPLFRFLKNAKISKFHLQLESPKMTFLTIPHLKGQILTKKTYFQIFFDFLTKNPKALGF